uniref:Retrotransposon gag domain-containing protein n=1 Tax=Fagus sylvatica TaxID=28930 RepID=A0A2N9FI11_FAGSY
MMGETSGPSAQDIRMASFEEKFNDLLKFRRKDYEEYKDGGCISLTSTWPSLMWRMKREQLIPTSHSENDPSPKGNWNTLEGPQSLQMYGNGEENVMNKKEDDHFRHQNKESEKEAQSPISKKEEPKEVDHPMIPHKRYTPKNVTNRKAIRDLASHSTYRTGKYEVTKQKGNRKTPKARKLSCFTLGDTNPAEIFLPSAKLKSESRKFCTLPMPMDELYPRLLEKRLISPVFLKQSPHLLHDSSKKCEFHFGRPGHSLEDCHALKNKVQDLVDHGILRINEGSTPSVIIAWPPEHCKDETVIPSPQSQGPTTCGIQPVHLTMLPTLSEVGEHTVPKTQPKLMSNFRNLDDQCSSDKEKAEYCTNRCVTLKRKIQELGHSELEVPFHGPSQEAKYAYCSHEEG